MILFGYAFVYIKLVCYVCLSIYIYTTEFYIVGMKSMLLYYILLLLIYIEIYLLEY